MSNDRVLLQPVRPKMPGLLAYLDGEEQIAGGVGGWSDVSRPRRVAAVEYVGTPAYERTIPLLITGAEAEPGVDLSVEDQCRLLFSMGRRTKKTGEPPLLQVLGAGLVLKSAGARWVITGIQLGAAIRNDGGRRVQQEVTVTLKQHVDADVQRRPAKAARDRKRKRKGKSKGADWGPQ